MKIKYEDLSKIIEILQEAKNELSPGEYFEFKSGNLEKKQEGLLVLPKKFCIKVTNENIKDLQLFQWSEFFKPGYDYTLNAYYWNKQDSNGYCSGFHKPGGYIELTHEEFNRLVRDSQLPF